MTDVEAHGPIDFILLEFPGEKLTGRAAEAVADLVEKGIVRIYDIVIVRKDEDGTFSGVELTESSIEAGGFTAFAGASSGLLSDDDVRQAADALEPGTVAALIVYENTWAIPFVSAVVGSGGQMVASVRIAATDVMAALEALEAND